jgi:hypothetical protein
MLSCPGGKINKLVNPSTVRIEREPPEDRLRLREAAGGGGGRKKERARVQQKNVETKRFGLLKSGAIKS